MRHHKLIYENCRIPMLSILRGVVKIPPSVNALTGEHNLFLFLVVLVQGNVDGHFVGYEIVAVVSWRLSIFGELVGMAAGSCACAAFAIACIGL
jgi:hypothetical protein